MNNLTDIEEILLSQSYKPKKNPTVTKKEKSPQAKPPTTQFFKRRSIRLTTAPNQKISSPLISPKESPLFTPLKKTTKAKKNLKPETIVPELEDQFDVNQIASEIKVPKFPKRRFGDCQQVEPSAGFLSLRSNLSERDMLRFKRDIGRIGKVQKKRTYDPFEYTNDLVTFRYVVHDIFFR